MNSRLLSPIVALAFSSCAMRLANTGNEANVAIKESGITRSASREQRVFEQIPNNRLSTGDFRMTGITNLSEQPGCSMPLLGTIFSAGLLPSSIPVDYVARVSGYEHGHAQTREYLLTMGGHYSLWQSLVPASHDDKVLARALIASMSDGSRGPYPIKHSGSSE
jgi:hypothetical protein